MKEISSYNSREKKIHPVIFTQFFKCYEWNGNGMKNFSYLKYFFLLQKIRFSRDFCLQIWDKIGKFSFLWSFVMMIEHFLQIKKTRCPQK